MAEHLRSVSGFERVIDVREAPLSIKSFASYPIHETFHAQQQTEAQKVLSSLHFFATKFKGPRSFDSIEAINGYIKKRNNAMIISTDSAQAALIPPVRTDDRWRRMIFRYDSQTDDYLPDGQLVTDESKPFTGDEIRYCMGFAVVCDSAQGLGIQLHPSDTAVLYERDGTDFVDDELSSERLKHAILYKERNMRNTLVLPWGLGSLAMSELIKKHDESQYCAA